MTRIIGIAGSLRQGSYNAALLRNAAELTPAGCSVQTASIKDIPLYDGDLEAQSGIPPAVAALKDLVAGADGLLLVTPEYNNSIARVFGERPIGLIGTTPGGMGTTFAQTAWLPILRTLGTRPFFGKTLYVSGAAKVFDAEGKLIDKDLRERLRVYMEQFATFVGAARALAKPK